MVLENFIFTKSKHWNRGHYAEFTAALEFQCSVRPVRSHGIYRAKQSKAELELGRIKPFQYSGGINAVIWTSHVLESGNTQHSRADVNNHKSSHNEWLCR